MNPIGPIDPVAVRSPDAATRAEVRKAAEAFEALLLQSLIKKMRAAQLQDGLFGKETGSSTYEAMFDQHLAEKLAEGSPLGLADLFEARLLDRTLPDLQKLRTEIDRGRALAAIDSIVEAGGHGNPRSGSVEQAAQVVPGQADE